MLGWLSGWSGLGQCQRAPAPRPRGSPQTSVARAARSVMVRTASRSILGIGVPHGAQRTWFLHPRCVNPTRCTRTGTAGFLLRRARPAHTCRPTRAGARRRRDRPSGLLNCGADNRDDRRDATAEARCGRRPRADDGSDESDDARVFRDERHGVRRDDRDGDTGTDRYLP